MKTATNQERLAELFESDPRRDSAIGKSLGVSKQTVSAWRCGTRSPKKPTLIKIAEEYNVSIEWLMGFDVERTGYNRAAFLPDIEVFRKIILGMEPDDYETVMRIFEKTERRMKEMGRW